MSDTPGYGLSGPQSAMVNTRVTVQVVLAQAQMEAVTIEAQLSGVEGVVVPDVGATIPAGTLQGSVSFVGYSLGTATILTSNSGGLSDPPGGILVQITPTGPVIPSQELPPSPPLPLGIRY